MRETARALVPTRTTTSSPTTDPIFTPIGRSANHPPGRPDRVVRDGTVMTGLQWGCGASRKAVSGDRRRPEWRKGDAFRGRRCEMAVRVARAPEDWSVTAANGVRLSTIHPRREWRGEPDRG